MYDCNEGLRYGVFNESMVKLDRSISKSLFEWLKESSYETVKQASDGGLTIGLPVEGVEFAIGGEFSKENFEKWKRMVESGKARSFTEKEAMSIVKRTVAPEVFEAWVKCVTRNEQGLVIDLDVAEEDNVLVFEARYIPDDEDDEFPVVMPNGFQLTGATTQYPLKEGDEIPFAGVSVTCERIGLSAVTVVLNTSRGTKSDSEPEIEPPPKKEQKPEPKPTPPRRKDYKLDVKVEHDGAIASVDGPTRGLKMFRHVKYVWTFGVDFLPRLGVPVKLTHKVVIRTNPDNRFKSKHVFSPSRIKSLKAVFVFDDGEKRRKTWTNHAYKP
jgi:hypothetical protein